MDDTIIKTYNDPSKGLKSVNKIFYELKETIPKETIKRVLNELETYQLTKPHKVVNYYKITAPAGYFQCDMMYFKELKGSNGGVIGLITFIEIITRKGYFEPIKNETGKTAREKLKILIDRVGDVKHIQFDKGSVFTDKATKNMLDKENIGYSYAETGDKTAQGIVERFNRTIRTIINKYLMLKKDPKMKFKNNYVNKLKEFETNYNNTIHSTLGTSPNDMTEDKIREFRLDLDLHNAIVKSSLDINVGDTVRKKNKKGKFDKSGDIWSKKLYTVVEIVGNRYKINNNATKYNKRHLMSHNDLLKVLNVREEKPEEQTQEQKEEVRQQKATQRIKKEGALAPVVDGKRKRTKKREPGFVYDDDKNKEKEPEKRYNLRKRK